MYSSWIVIFFVFTVITSSCNGQARPPNNRDSSVTRSQSETGSQGNRVKLKSTDTGRPHSPDRRVNPYMKIDELQANLDRQKTAFVTHKRDFDSHIDSFERRFSTVDHGMKEMIRKMQALEKKNIELENQLKSITEQFVLIPKEKVKIPDNEEERDNSTHGRSVTTKSTVEEYLSNRGAELIDVMSMPPKKNSQKQKVAQRTTTSSRSGNHKIHRPTLRLNNNSSNKQKPDYITDAMLRLFAQDKLTNDRLFTLEAQLKAIDLAESVTTTIIVEACNETDSTTEILELKDMEKRVSDLEKHIVMNRPKPILDYDLKEEQTNRIVEARGKKKYSKNEVFESRAASDARKSLFSAARTTPFFGSDKEFRKITFNHTYVNKGKNFVRNSTFKCHLNGYYFFTFTIRSRDDHTPYVTLMKNIEPQTSISADPSLRNIMQSQSTILQLNEHDEVWLRVGPNSKYALDSEVTNKYITFTGFLIYKGS